MLRYTHTVIFLFYVLVYKISENSEKWKWKSLNFIQGDIVKLLVLYDQQSKAQRFLTCNDIKQRKSI